MKPGIVFSIFALVFSGYSAGAHTEKEIQLCSYLPENNLKFPIQPEDSQENGFRSGGLSKREFDTLLDKLERIYLPEFSARGTNFVIQRLWHRDNFNAMATRRGSNWIIMMYGGMARHPGVTSDGFAQVACHEIGHHIGGAPLFRAGMSNEGQSDYFSALKCMRKLFARDNNRVFLNRRDVPRTLLSECRRSYRSQNDQGICVRIGLAGLTMTKILADMRDQSIPRVSTPSRQRVSRTSDGHPQAQCRLDTVFQGAICPARLSGQLSDSDPNIGTCSRKFNDRRGVRPLCWYNPG